MVASGNLPVAPLPWPGHPRWSRSAVAAWAGGAEDLGDDGFRLLTIPEVADRLGMSRSSAYRVLPMWASAGYAVRCATDWRIPVARLAYLVEQS